jgi:formylglycine-generating enzyme
MNKFGLSLILLLTGIAGTAFCGAPALEGMVSLPGGEFVMGRDGSGDYAPAHTVRISAFLMDAREVTNAQYKEFCDRTERKLPIFWGMEEFRCGPDFADHPVVGVSFYDARSYAEWRGVRLPTEAEWEYAARGGHQGWAYSHGDTLHAHLYAPTKEGTSPVGSFPANGFGLYDMTGNVLEWVTDYYDGNYYDTSSPVDPQGPATGKFRVIRGGGWHTGPSCAKVHHRTGLQSNWLDFNVGFRCAADIPVED